MSAAVFLNMPSSPANRRHVSAARGQLKALLGWHAGVECESMIMMLARRVVALASAADKATLDAGERPHWLTLDVVGAWNKGDFSFKPPEVVVEEPAAPAVGRHRERGRAVDAYLREHRPRLKESVGALPWRERETALKRAGANEFSLLAEKDQQDRIDRATETREAAPALADASRPLCTKRQLQEFGKILVDLVSNDDGDDDAHVKQLRRTARLVTAEAFAKKAISSDTLRKKLGIGKRLAASGRPRPKIIKDGCTKKMGRPLKVTDDFLKSTLLPLSKASCRFKRNGEAISTIPKSWRRLHLGTMALKSRICYIQLLRRTRLAKLAIVRGKKTNRSLPSLYGVGCAGRAEN